MMSFTDLTDVIVAEILCDWCDVKIIAKVDSAFCNHDSTRTWLLNIISKYCCTVPKTVKYSFDFLKWVSIREIELKELRLVKSLTEFIQHEVLFRLSGVESLIFSPCDYSWDGLEGKSCITLISGCFNLKKLSINSYVSFDDSHLPMVSPLILSQLVSLELTHDESEFKETFDMLSIHCNNLDTLFLSGDMMCRDGVVKLISSNSKLQTLNVDCLMVGVSDIYDALVAARNSVVTHITTEFYDGSNFVDTIRSAAKLLQYCKSKSLIYLHIVDVVRYEVEKYDHCDRNILLNVDARTMGMAKTLFDELSIVNTIYINSDSGSSLQSLMQLVTEYYSRTLTSLICVDNLRKSLSTSSIVERMLTSCVHVKHIKLVSANQFGGEYMLRLCELYPQLRHVEYKDIKVTSATVIAILSSSTNNVTKVTARFCIYILALRVHATVKALNAMPNRTKTVEFVDESCC